MPMDKKIKKYFAMTLSSHHLQFYHIRTQNKINLGILPGVSLEKNRPEDLSMKAIKIILKTVLLISLAIHGLLSAIVPANADEMTGVNIPRFPETYKPETHGSLTIDHSHASDGYIIVKAPRSSRNLKVAISFDGETKIHYNLNTDGEEEILPLQ